MWTLRRAAIAASITVLGTSCTLIGSSAKPLYVPETAGVVRAREISGQDLRFRLTNGQTLVVPTSARFINSQPTEGDLILVGREPDAWIMHVRFVPPQPDVNPPGCYQLFGSARATATHVYKTVSDGGTYVEIAFRKAGNWMDIGFLGSTDQLRGEYTCLDENGLAFDHH